MTKVCERTDICNEGVMMEAKLGQEGGRTGCLMLGVSMKGKTWMVAGIGHNEERTREGDETG